jgi:hypothetical protein
MHKQQLTGRYTTNVESAKTKKTPQNTITYQVSTTTASPNNAVSAVLTAQETMAIADNNRYHHQFHQ